MSSRLRLLTGVALAVGLAVAVVLAPARQARARDGSTAPTGGAPIGGLAPTNAPSGKIPRPPGKKARGRWLRGVTITEYWPAPEQWFVGALVRAPGLAGKHRIDWLYSAMGVSMQGEGIGLDGQIYHLRTLGKGGWVTAKGRATTPGGGWDGGVPYWRAGDYWHNRQGAVTFPLQLGGWSSGPGVKYVPLRRVSFAPGPSLPLRSYQSIAVDPGVVPLGSRVYIPAYRHDGHGGWFIAQDTGGAISGRRVDVYRTPPASPTDPGRYLARQRVFVVKPHR